MNIDFPRYNIERFSPSSKNSENFKLFEFNSPSELLSVLENSEVTGEHIHAFYTIFWVNSGTCSQYVDGIKHNVESNHLLFISPLQVHNNSIDCSDDLKGGVMMFTGEFIANHNNIIEMLMLTTSTNNPVVTIIDDDLFSIKNTISSIKSEYHHHNVKESILTILFSGLVSQIERVIDIKFKPEINNHAVDTYKKFIMMVEANFKENLSIEVYAESLAMSSKHLNRIIKKVIGTSPSDVIIRRKLLEAKRLLSYTNMTIQQIADELNYTDSSYFNRLYKRAFGINPSALRKK